MSRIILLDTGPLGRITSPKATPENQECAKWLSNSIASGNVVVIPEISDYELRRELIRNGSTKAITRLDELKISLGYIPITTETMIRAAEFWAKARKMGMATADDKALDGDMILSAQASILTDQGHEVVIATTNVKHLSIFANAKLWQEIT
jgi:predicted nucleic acid-binding protein